MVVLHHNRLSNVLLVFHHEVQLHGTKWLQCLQIMLQKYGFSPKPPKYMTSLFAGLVNLQKEKPDKSENNWGISGKLLLQLCGYISCYHSKLYLCFFFLNSLSCSLKYKEVRCSYCLDKMLPRVMNVDVKCHILNSIKQHSSENSNVSLALPNVVNKYECCGYFVCAHYSTVQYMWFSGVTKTNTFTKCESNALFGCIMNPF